MTRLFREEFSQQGEGLLVGEQVHVNHQGCPAGEDVKKRLYIKRVEAGLIAFCHHCGNSGYAGDKMDASRVRRRLFPPVSTETVKVVVLPPDMTYDLRKFDPKAMAWLYRYHFTQTMIKFHAIGWSPQLHRVILPVARSSLRGWQGRSVDGRDPKYMTQRAGDAQLFGHWYVHTDSEQVVIVEDLLSAYRLAAHENVVALLGTHITDEVRNYIQNRYVRALVFMDPDGAGRIATRRIVKALSVVVPYVAAVTSEVQPKELSDKQLDALLSGYRTSSTSWKP